MPRRPEIGNVQLYPNRPLRRSDKNGFVLKFYCPLRLSRIRMSCGTRDRRDARRIQRECQERLLNGQYVASGGAITSQHIVSRRRSRAVDVDVIPTATTLGMSWQDAVDRYRQQRMNRVRDTSLEHAVSRLSLAERILESHRAERGLSEGLLLADVLTLDMLEYLQDRFLAGEDCRYERRSANTVNSMMGAVMAFARFCHSRSWIAAVPAIQKLDVDSVMKGRPVTAGEFDIMLEAVPTVVGIEAAPSWQFAMRVLWESGFRVGDLMDFSWDDERHIHPVWSTVPGQHPTILIPSTQKNGQTQEIPMLPGLCELLSQVPVDQRRGWIVNPVVRDRINVGNGNKFKPCADDLRTLAQRFSNLAIARACGVTETAVRKWLSSLNVTRDGAAGRLGSQVPDAEIDRARQAASTNRRAVSPIAKRLSKEHVGRVIAQIGEVSGVVVQREDERLGKRVKFASAHDLRRGCALRLINAGVSAETLKVVMRHKDFATTEKHYGALRSAQSAASEVHAKLNANATNDAFVGGLMGGTKDAPQLTEEELAKLKSFLETL